MLCWHCHAVVADNLCFEDFSGFELDTTHGTGVAFKPRKPDIVKGTSNKPGAASGANTILDFN